MTVHITGEAAEEFGWLLGNLLTRLPQARAVALLTVDGLLMAAASAQAPALGSDQKGDSEKTAAIAASLLAVARAAGRTVDDNPGVRQAIAELTASTLYIRDAGKSAALAVLVNHDAEPSVVGYEMDMLITSVGERMQALERSKAGPDTPAG